MRQASKTLEEDVQQIDDIGLMRSEIDSIDRSVAYLLAERAQISHAIQNRRISSGGTRTDITRERDVITTYRAKLGKRGSFIAYAILGFCKEEQRPDANGDLPEG